MNVRKVFVCARKKEFLDLPGYENYQLIENTERVTLSPVYIKRIQHFWDVGIVLISRNQYITSILNAAEVPYEVFY